MHEIEMPAARLLALMGYLERENHVADAMHERSVRSADTTMRGG